MIEFFVYVRDPTPVEIASLKSTIRQAGWIVHVVRGWLGSNGFDLISDGELEDDDRQQQVDQTLGRPPHRSQAIRPGQRRSGGQRLRAR